MSLTVNFNVPSRHHHHHHHRGFRRRQAHIPSMGFHFNRPIHSYTTLHVKGKPLAVSSLLVGIAALVAALAVIIFGAVLFVPAALGVGIFLGVAAIALIATGGACIHRK